MIARQSRRLSSDFSCRPSGHFGMPPSDDPKRCSRPGEGKRHDASGNRSIGGPHLNALAKLLRALNSETDPAQIALGACFGFVMGLTPLFSLHNLVVLFLALVLRANLMAFLLSLTLFPESAMGWGNVSILELS